MDLAVVDRAPVSGFEFTTEAGRDMAGRVGLRSSGFSFGASALQGLSGEKEFWSDAGLIDMGAVRALGFDAEWSRGFLTVGGEGIRVDIDERRSTGYYLQASYDLSSVVRGLRLVGKYDVLNDGSLDQELRIHRRTLGARFTVRRDLDIQAEIDFDRRSGGARDGTDSHVIMGLVYRF